MRSLAKNILLVAIFFPLIFGSFFSMPLPAHAQGSQGLGQLGPLPFKDLDCDSNEDITGLNMLSNTITRAAWTLLCPGKVDKNCDGRSDLNGTRMFSETIENGQLVTDAELALARQCPNGFSSENKDNNCDGRDDRYPNIDVRKTDYWNRICPDPTQYKDANCDGVDDVLKISFFNPNEPELWQIWGSLCPGKIDQNCDGYSDFTGIKYFVDNPQNSQQRTDFNIHKLQCPSGYRSNGHDANCDGYDDTPLGYTNQDPTKQYGTLPSCANVAEPGYVAQPNVPQPICLDITNTQSWKLDCSATIRYIDQNCDGTDDISGENLKTIDKLPAWQQLCQPRDTDCDGIDDRTGTDLLGTSEAMADWTLMCPTKVDRNCDGYADSNGSGYSGRRDAKGNMILLPNEPFYKKMCPSGFSIQNRDTDCDGYDDKPIGYQEVTNENGVKTRKPVYLYIANTYYWQNLTCKKASSGVIGSSPFGDLGGGKDLTSETVSDASLTCAQINFRFTSFKAISCTIQNIVSRIFVPLAFVLATLLFIYGVIKYYMAADSTDKRAEGRRYMLWAIIALFIMVSIWGIVRLATDTLGFRFDFPPQLKEE